MEIGWHHYAAIKLLMAKYGLLNLDPEKYADAINELLEILEL